MADLKKTLGLAQLALYAIGMIIGAGIYSVLGEAAGIAGYGLWLAFGAGAVAALFTGLSYAELATAFPKAGAEYVYLRQVAPGWRWPSTVVGIVLVLAGAASASTVTLAFAGYLGAFLPLSGPVVAVALLVLMTAVNVFGMQTSARINAVFTVIEVAGLGVVVALGVGRPEFASRAFENVSLDILPATAIVFFAFLGFEEIANLAEEARRPARDLPRAILIGIVVSSVLYVLVSLAATSLLSPEQLAASDSPLADAAGRASASMGPVLAVIALFATANTGLISLIATSRLVFGIARGGDLPPAVARVLPGRGTPWVAALVTLLLAVALAAFGGIGLVAGVASFAALVAFLSVNTAVVILRFRMPRLERPFRVPLSIGRMPILPLVGVATTLLLISQFDATVYLAGGIALAVGAVVALLRGAWARD